MKNFIIMTCLLFAVAFALLVTNGCEEALVTTTTTLYNNDIPFPTSAVVFQLNDLSGSSASSIRSFSTRNRGQELVTDAYAQAGIDLGYFEGFDPVLSTFRAQTLTAIATDEFTFEDSYGHAEGDIPFKGHVQYVSAESKYLVQVWGIRPGETEYRRWLYGDFVSTSEGSIIIDPYIMWTSTHDYPMTIKFQYDATIAETKICTGGATGTWNASKEVIGSSYFYCMEDRSDPSNTIVTFQMYQHTTNETSGVAILNKLYGKFNRDTERLNGRFWTDAYPLDNPDSGLLYVNTETYATIEGTVPSNVDASSMTFPATPEAGFAAWPDTSEFPATPTF